MGLSKGNNDQFLSLFDFIEKDPELDEFCDGKAAFKKWKYVRRSLNKQGNEKETSQWIEVSKFLYNYKNMNL